MVLSNLSQKCRFYFKSYALRLSAISVISLIGTTNLGWGSLAEEHRKLDDAAVLKWYITKFPAVDHHHDQKYMKAGGSIHKKNDAFSVFVRQKDGINRIRVIYHGKNDLSSTPLSSLEKAEPILAKNLYKTLGVDLSTYKFFLEAYNIHPNTPTFPSNLTGQYQFMSSNELMGQLIQAYPLPTDSLWSLAGGPVSAVGAVKLFIESGALNQGKSVKFRLNVMGTLPQYTWDFLASLRMKNKITVILPTDEGKWFPVLKEILPSGDIEYFEKTKKEAESIRQ